MSKLNIINACGLSKLVFELPEHLVLVNKIIGYCREHDLVLDENDLDEFNSVFWAVVFSLYDCKLLNSSADTDSTIAFVIRDEKLGIAYGSNFYFI
ncbi:hypothetical protein [Serratia liquefaciens]|uniref:hypothetical protein n=1 Tax=Serratia liquefaciens TaxID=614 RepID=UPI0011849C1E|nr:hypothetical protein [Serratia liquefaciens]